MGARAGSNPAAVVFSPILLYILARFCFGQALLFPTIFSQRSSRKDLFLYVTIWSFHTIEASAVPTEWLKVCVNLRIPFTKSTARVKGSFSLLLYNGFECRVSYLLHLYSDLSYNETISIAVLLNSHYRYIQGFAQLLLSAIHPSFVVAIGGGSLMTARILYSSLQQPSGTLRTQNPNPGHRALPLRNPPPNSRARPLPYFHRTMS